MDDLYISKLSSGGIITNYFCTSACHHCLYGCSPSWEKKYMDGDTAIALFRKIKELGCSVIHIGGGEPLLRPEKLAMILEKAVEEKVFIEYIETNSSWYQNHHEALELLKNLMQRGVTTLLISIDPFHNEFIPFAKVKGVMAACAETGMSIFPWSSDFFNDVNSFDDSRTHNLEAYIEKFGPRYLAEIPSRIWTHQGGRALKLYQDIVESRSTREIIEDQAPCNELADISHFHFDCYGSYIPGLCSGFSVSLEDIGTPLGEESYPFINLLYKEGVGSFLKMAEKEYGFTPGDTYISKCHLCFDIRQYLVMNKNIKSHELMPEDFYLFV